MTTVISEIEDQLGARTGLHAQLTGYVTTGVAQGLSLGTLIPLLSAMAAGRLGLAAGWLAAGSALALTSAVALRFTMRRSYGVSVLQISDALARRVAGHVVRLPLGWFGGGRTGRLAALLDETRSIGEFPPVVLQQITLALTTPATVAVVVAFVDWRLAVAFVVLAPLGLLAYRRIQASAAPVRTEAAEAEAEVAGRVLEFARAQPVLRATGAGAAPGGPARLAESLRADRRATVHTLNREALPALAYAGVVQLGLALVVVVTAWSFATGDVAGAAAVAVLVLAVRCAEPVAVVGHFGTGVALASVGARSVGEVLATPPLPEPAAPRVPADGTVDLDAVTFGYGGDPVLRDFTLHCPAGTMTALVGPSGAGKTTVTRLIARFWDVESGSVRIGGVDVRDMATADLMHRIAMVFQDVYLFDASVDENVRLGRPDATDEELASAARVARLDEVVERLPEGWSTTAGEGGQRLSGGERQRVSIARAVLKDAPILLLDEVTASLDADNEALVSSALHELARDRTVLVIAHRLSTVAAADRIAFVDDGGVVEQGTHAELLAHGGRYAAFWADREVATRWRIGAREE